MPSELTRQIRGTRSCQHCGKSAKALGSPLRACAACKSCHYCNQQCQKEDWKAHKPLCELRISVLRNLREEKAIRGIQPDEYDPELVASISNNWVQWHRPMISGTLFHALKLPFDTKCLGTHAILLDLKPTFPPTKTTASSKDIPTAFELVSIAMMTIEEMTELLGPVNGPAILVQQRVEAEKDRLRTGRPAGLATMRFTAGQVRIWRSCFTSFSDTDIKNLKYRPDWPILAQKAFKEGWKLPHG